MATPAAAMDFSLPPAAPPGDVSAEAMEMQRSWLAAPPKKRRKKGRGATTKIKKPAEVPFDQLVHDVKYGQFARDVHRLNSNSSRFVTREQMRQSWESTVRMAHHRWARDYKGPGAGRADLGSKLLAEALAQANGYEGFDLDAYWNLQGAMRKLDAMSMTAEPTAKMVTGCEEPKVERRVKKELKRRAERDRSRVEMEKEKEQQQQRQQQASSTVKLQLGANVGME